jgi:NAD(P)H-hydrate epimerase
MEIDSEDLWDQISVTLPSYDIVVDAMLGTGIETPLRGLFSRVVSDINDSRAFVLSVDMPSGMFSDSVEAAPQTIWADLTVTFTAPKIAQILNHDIEAVGDLDIVPIGTPAELMDRSEYWLNLLTLEEVHSAWVPRSADSHKGTFGHVAIVAGSRGKSGAAILGATSALRAGSGLATIMCPNVVQDRVASVRPEIMTEGLPSTAAGTLDSAGANEALELMRNLDAAGIGPGLTTESETVAFIRSFVRDSPIPLVIDADGLNAFAGESELFSNRNDLPLILTPHPGEFARLLGTDTASVTRDPLTLAREFAQTHSLWLVLKSFRTLVACPDGAVFASAFGNPGMATAGMGDVLTGVLTSCLGQYWAQGLKGTQNVTKAVCLGVVLHGLAGDLAAEETGFESLIAGDLLDCLSEAYKTIEEGE